MAAKKAPAKKSTRMKVSKRKSLRRTELYKAITAKLVAEYEWEEGTRPSLIKDVVAATVDTILSNSVAERGIALPGFGKLTWKYRKAREAGTVHRFGQDMEVKARPATWIPRFRLQRSAKVALLEQAPEA